jgi:hypothetical protein
MTAEKSFFQGRNLSDISGNLTWLVRPNVELSATAQHEHWKFPLLGAGVTSNFTTTFDFGLFPKARVGSE